MDQKKINAEMQEVSAYATKQRMNQREVPLLEETKGTPKATNTNLNEE
ncbi:hypothetical protein ACTID9_14020 [Brevibacillus fluminis]